MVRYSVELSGQYTAFDEPVATLKVIIRSHTTEKLEKKLLVREEEH